MNTNEHYLRIEDEAFVITPRTYDKPIKRQRHLPEGTDIIKEYELIQRKASTLSRWERDQVVKIFEHNFKAI